MEVIIWAVLIVAIVILSFRYVNEKFLLTYCEQKSSIDGNTYKIACGYEDPQGAANLLAMLNNKALKLIEHLNRKYKDKGTDAAMLTKNLTDRYRGYSRLVETNPDNKEGDTSYTLDKGYLLSMCLRCSKSMKVIDFHTINTLTFVFLHELAHIAAKVSQHHQNNQNGYDDNDNDHNPMTGTGTGTSSNHSCGRNL